MGVTDCHVHVNPLWEMKADAVRLLEGMDAETARVVHEPDRLLERMDAAGIERAVLINYVAPEVIGYTEAANEFVGQYVRADPVRLIAA